IVDGDELKCSLCGPVGRGLVASVDLCEPIPDGDLVAPLRPAADPDRVVDRVVFRAPACAELEREAAETDRGYAGDEALAVERDLADDRRRRENLDRGVAALCLDPALERRECRA